MTCTRLEKHNVRRKWIEITTVIGCRVGCTYCPQKSLTSNYRLASKNIHLNVDDFKHYLATVPSNIEIAFSGYAEPFLNPGCLEMIKHAQMKGHPLVASSTLEGMTIETAKALIKIPFRRFLVHLANSQGQEKIKLDNRYFEILSIFDGVENFKFHSDGYTAHPDILKRLSNIRTHQVHDRAGNSDITSSAETLAKNVKITGPITCDRIQGNVLLPNGDVTICCMDFGMKHVIGNLKDMSYEDIFKTPEYTELLNDMDYIDSDILCRTCHKAVPAKPIKA